MTRGSYVNTLPAETLLRVWDLLIFEDASVLVRVGVALLKLAEEEVLPFAPAPTPDSTPRAL